MTEHISEVLQREYNRIQQIQIDRATSLIRLDRRKAPIVGHEINGIKGYPNGLYDVIDVAEYTLPAPACTEIVTPKTIYVGVVK